MSVRGSDRGSRSGEWLALAALALTLAAWSWTLSHRMAGPIIFHDELAPISLARHVRSGMPMAQVVVPHYPGYGVLLAAFVPAERDSTEAHRIARAVNALLLAAAGLAACALARVLMPGSALRSRLAVAFASCIHAPVVLFGHLSMPDNLLIAGVVVASALMARAFESPSAARVVVAGLTVGLLPSIHVRAVPVVLAAVAAWLAYLIFAKRGVRDAGRFLVPLALGATLSWMGARYTEQLEPPRGGLTHAHSVGRLATIVSTSRVKRIPILASGQLVYMSASTLGVAVAGLAGGAAWILRRRGSLAGAEGSTVFFVTLSAVGTALVAMVFLNTHAPRPDHWLNGRYGEAVVVPLLVLGFATLARVPRGSPRRAALRWGLGLAVTTACTGAVLLAAIDALHVDRPINPVNVMGVYPWIGDIEHPALERVVVVGTVLAALGVVTTVTHPALGRALFIAFAVASALWTSNRYLVRGSRDRAKDRTLPAAIARLEETGTAPDCIGLDLAEGTFWNAEACAFYRPRQRFRFFDPDAGGAPCSDLVVSARAGFAEVYPGARTVAREHGDEVRLWALPGPRQEALAERGFLEPAKWGALPAAAMRSRLRWVSAPAAPGSTLFAPPVAVLAVQNASRSSPWLSAGQLGRPELAVRVGVRWFRAGDRSKVVVESRAELPLELLPGGQVDVPIELPPVAPVIAPGRYHIVVGLLQEGVSWFQHVGDPVLETDVTVD